MRLLALLVALLALPAAVAQPPAPPEVEQWAITNGVPLDLDSNDTQVQVHNLRNRISGQAVHDCVFNITTDLPNSYRVMGTPTQDLFLAQYGNVFGELGLPTALHHFQEGAPGLGGVEPPEQLQGGVNIIGVLPGKDTTKWVVLGAHYDTRELTLGGGALDNAAGLCTVLELARAMYDHTLRFGQLEASLVFIWYDGEEWGLYGSRAFAEDPSVANELLGNEPSVSPNVLVSQSFDMPGLNYPAKNNWVQYGDPTNLDEYAVLNLRTAPIHAAEEWACWSYGCYEDLKDRSDFDQVLRRNANYQFLVREIAYDVMWLPSKYVWVYDDHYGRSDHIPLIAAGSAGMRIQGAHDEEYPHYHQPTDSLPGVYAITGGTPNGIIAGFDVESEVGGLTAFFVAKTGGLGHYGDVLFFGDNATALKDRSGEPAPLAEKGNDAPLPASVALLGLGLAGAALRRRRDNA